MHPYFYSAFGLVIKSQCECPELMSAPEQEYQASVEWGMVPEHLEDATLLGTWIEGLPHKLLFRITGVAQYLVEDGNRITIQLEEGASTDEARLFLLGSAMGALLHQRGLLPFHGSSICTGAKAITFTGPSGIGKSTLAAAMVNKKYHLLADDVSAISFEGQKALVNPGMPQLKLYKDSIQKLNRDTSHAVPLSQKRDKFGCPEHPSFILQAFPAQTIFILSPGQDAGFKATPLSGLDKFIALRNNTYRPYFVKAMGIQQAHFDLIRLLASQVDVYLLSRPDTGFEIDELAGFVDNMI